MLSNNSINDANRALRQKSLKVNYDKKFNEMEVASSISSKIKGLKTTNESLKKCMKILLYLKKNINSDPFLMPVDPVALKIPDYPLIVKEPMDISTVEKKLMNNII